MVFLTAWRVLMVAVARACRIEDQLIPCRVVESRASVDRLEGYGIRIE